MKLLDFSQYLVCTYVASSCICLCFFI